MQRSTSSGLGGIVWGDSTGDTDEGVDGEPFIVNLNDADSTQLILIVGERFLWEKNIDGDILEKLDLKLLETLQQRRTPSSQYSVKLTFGYMRRDRQGRSYNLEDEGQRQSFCAHMMSHIEAKAEANRFKDLLHCLKCAAEFHKSKGITRDLQFDAKGNVKANNYVCPNCQSTMVMELDAEQLAQSRRNGVETPIGSLKSLDNGLPLASSSTVATPVKTHSSDIDRDSDSFKSLPTTYSSLKSNQMSPSFPTPYLSQESSDSPSPVQSYATADPDSTSERSVSPQMVAPAVNGSNGEFLEYTENSSENSTKKEVTRYSSEPFSYGRTESAGPHTSSHMNAIARVQGKSGSNQSRQRIDSGESDITIISNPSQSSIMVLRNPSHDELATSDETLKYNNKLRNPISISPVSNRSLSLDAGANLLMPNHVDDTDDASSDTDAISPYGSLTTKTVSSMINSVYELTCSTTEGSMNNDDSDNNRNSIDGAVNVTAYSSGAGGDTVSVTKPSDGLNVSSEYNSLTTSSSDQDTPLSSLTSADSKLGAGSNKPAVSSDIIQYNYNDVTQIDHRLKLWLTMNVFKDTEECRVLLKCDVVQYMIPEHYPAILITTDKRIFIFKITGEEKDNPAKWLKCIETQPITELQYIDIGLNYQCVRLEFSTDFSSYTCIVRDEERCKRFMAVFTGVIQSSSLSTKSKLEGISKNFSETLEHINEQVLIGSDPEDCYTEDELEVTELIACYLHETDVKPTGKGHPHMKPVSIITTKTLICLTSQNYQWPLPRLQGPLSDKVKATEFTLIDKKHINEVAQLNTYADESEQLTIEFFAEETKDDNFNCWEVVMETEASCNKLIKAIREPWEDEFNVTMTIVELPSADAES